MTRIIMQKLSIESLEQSLGHEFRNSKLITEALTHRSHYHEYGDSPHNERLEFLGDTVLGLCVSEMLLEHFSEAQEGPLSRLRSELVSEKCLSRLALELDIPLYLRLGKGERSSGGAQRSSLLADTFEAVLGALYLDGGLECCRSFLRKKMPSRVQLQSRLGFVDHKSRLQELLQAEGLGTPFYRCVGEKGPEHDKYFVMCAELSGLKLAVDSARTKKAATQKLAQTLLKIHSDSPEDFFRRLKEQLKTIESPKDIKDIKKDLYNEHPKSTNF